MNIDVRTLSIVLAFSSVIQVIAIYLQYSLNKAYKGINWWILGSTLSAFAFTLLYLRDSISIPLISIIIPNLLIILGQTLHYIGILRFQGKKENRGFIISVLVVFVLVYLCFTYLNDDIKLRGAVLFTGLLVFALLTAGGLVINKTRSIAASAYSMAGLFFIQSIFYIFAVAYLFSNTSAIKYYDSTIVHILTFIITFVTGILLTIALIIMVNQRLNSETKEAKDHFEAIFNTSPDATFIARLDDGRIININDGFTKITGFNSDEVIGKSILEGNFGLSHIDHQKIVNELKGKGSFDNFETAFLRKDGSQCFGLTSAKIINLQDVPCIISVTRDISRSKEAEKALRESEEFRHILLENSPYPVLVRDANSTLLYVNPAFEKFTGFLLPEVIGTGLPAPWWPEKDMSGNCLVNRMPSRSEWNTREILTRNKNGELFWTEVTGGPIMKDGQLKYLVSNWVDINDRKKAEEALKESEEYLRKIFDSVLAGIVVIDAETHIIVDVNDVAVKMVGDEKSRIIGSICHNYVCPADFGRCPVTELHQNVDNSERKLITRTGPKEIIKSVVPIVRGGRKQLLEIFIDITGRKKAEEERRIAFEQLSIIYDKEKQQRQELQEESKARGMFIDILGHELRTPLTPLMVSTDMLQDILIPQDRGTEKRLVENIHAGAYSLAQRLEELLDLAKFSRGTFTLRKQPVEMADLVNKVAIQFRPLIEQQSKHFAFEIQGDLPRTESDPSRLEQVLVNLLSNAVKYSPKNTTITLKAGKINNYVFFEVHDEGIGISPEEQKKLFSPYHRVEQDSQKYPGIGLGLAVSKKIVEAHGGNIRVESQRGRGSAFIVQIPVNKGPEDINPVSAG